MTDGVYLGCYNGYMGCGDATYNRGTRHRSLIHGGISGKCPWLFYVQRGKFPEQRDIEDIRNYLETDGERVGCINSVIYDCIDKGYRLEQIYKKLFEMLANGGKKMITDYQSRKKEVLDSYEMVEELVSKLSKNAQKMDMPDPLERIDVRLTDIRGKAKKVRADRFTIMIAGESKSGKSTFINAYLGIELLPMDVKQCTSAIVEIKYGEKFWIRATYADGRKAEITEDEAAKDFLKKNASLNDDYRDIPVPTINSEILVKSGLRAKSKGSDISIKEHEVEDLLKAPEVQEANIHNLPALEYNRKIWKYINERKNQWFDIVTEIEVFFPFGEEMHGIDIIDSPGVCARGGVAEITAHYIEKADAIIFLKPISGQALESTQFNQFIRNASVERNKNALFLVLTRATNVPSTDLRRLEDEAYRQFSNLDKSNILLVDSKAELYAKQLAVKDVDVKDELQKLNAAGTLDDFVVKAYADTNGLFGDGDKNDFIRALQEKSRFSEIYNALEVFGRKAHYILLGALLDSICKLYSKLWNDTTIQMDMFRQKAEDPTELAKKIALIKQELDEMNYRMYKGVDNVVRRFRGDGKTAKQKANGLIEQKDEESEEDKGLIEQKANGLIEQKDEESEEDKGLIEQKANGLIEQKDEENEEDKGLIEQKANGLIEQKDEENEEDKGLIEQKAEEIKADFVSQISKIDANSDSAFSELERYSIHTVDAFKEATKALQIQVVTECDKELVTLSDKSSIPFESLKPDFTESTFDDIRDSTRKKANERDSYEEGITFKKTHTYSRYSQSKHFSIIKDNIMERLETIKNDLMENLWDFVEEIRNRYIAELSKNTDAKKQELDSIMEAKKTAEDISEIVDVLKKFAKELEDEQSKATRIKGGIEKNVQ